LGRNKKGYTMNGSIMLLANRMSLDLRLS